MGINYANYELSFGTLRGDFLFKRDAEGGMDVLYAKPGCVVPDHVGYFEKYEWVEFCAVFNNRYGRGWSPNTPLVDASQKPISNSYEESTEELSPESS